MYIDHQRTLAGSVSCSGVGVHSGKEVNLAIKPAPTNHGIKFTRTDLPGSPTIPAHFNKVVDTSLATVLGRNGCIVSTIEHLMAAFAGLSIDNALVEIDGYEMPIMDGSAGPFTRLLQSAGVEEQLGPRFYFVVKEPIELKKNGISVCIHPCSTYKITYTIVYDHPLIQTQTYTVEVSDVIFEREISNARTYGFFQEYEMLKRFGLGRGASLDNVVVVEKDTIMNEGGLRFPDEFVRHKILDSIGDFSLLGMPILGHVVIKKSGHAFNHAFLGKFFSEKTAWETRCFPGIGETAGFQPAPLAI